MVLLHRDDECARLDKVLHACAAGTAGLVLVEGAAGCGKTRLLQYAADIAADSGLTVVQAAADPAVRNRDHALLHRLTAALSAPDAAPAPEHGRTPEPDPAATRTDGEGTAGAGRPEAPDVPGRTIDPDADATARFAALLRTACARGPLLLCVDDVQYADRRSLVELLRLTHTLRGAPLLTVFAQTPHHRTGYPGLHTELLRHPGFVRIRLTRLEDRGTAELAQYWGAPDSPAAVGRLHRLSGGNPLLLRALLAETGTGPDGSAEDAGVEPESGGPFAQAYATCLHRCGSAARRLALALAVLGPDADTRRATRLAGLGPDAATRALATLDTAGLAVGARLPHPTAAAAVLAALSPAHRRSLHRDAARVLHHALAEPAAVAGQLLAAGTAAHDWEIQALRDAARQETQAHGDPERAEALLRLARSGCADELIRLRITLQLAAHTWRLHPARAHRQLDEPLAALRAGRLSATDATWLARQLAAQGRVEEADEALGRRAGAAPSPLPDAPLGDLLARLPAATPARPADPPAGAAARWLHPGTEDDAPAAERLLTRTPLTQATFEPLGHALRTLVQHRPHRAVVWCRRLGEQTPARHAPGWQAAFATAHADALLRLGDLAGARREASAALGHLTGRGGPFLLAPLALLVQALTDQGEYATAAQHLQPALPGEEPYATVHALAFLRARGRYELATQRPQAALEEFLEVGRLAVRWGTDHPGLLPWRTDAAEALLHLGRPARAQALVTEQLALPESGGARLRGTSLRLSAATAVPGRRTELLSDAVGALRDSGDRLELARALADLGSALQMSGEGNRAGTITRRAWQLAADCGAAPLCEQILPVRGAEPSARADAAPDTGLLSDAEERVATLAAQGYTNREIAGKLFVSVSTVEHHLTRVYRKLGISRRRDLPADLRTRPLEPTAVPPR
ncbi:AAA family ATPase [Streptomyces sp. NPDC054834]